MAVPRRRRRAHTGVSRGGCPGVGWDVGWGVGWGTGGWRRAGAALLLLNALSLPDVARSQCHNKCSGHGSCNIYGQCTCADSWSGADCSELSCPKHFAWVDYPSATDTAHALAECSNMGICDRKTGKCLCRRGFEGLACDRLSCPSSLELDANSGSLAVPPCNGHGECLSMREAAAFTDGTSLFRTGVTYDLWDADKIYGCACDDGYTGYDCSLRSCAKGDDPLTTVHRAASHPGIVAAAQADESHTIVCTCNGCQGTWKYSFRGEMTAPIAHDATQATVKAAIELLDAVRTVTVSFSAGSAACSSAGNVITITYTKDSGDLPPASVESALVLQTFEVQTATCSATQTLEVQTATCTATAGTFTLTFNSQTTAPIAFNALPATVKAALEALSTVTADGLVVTYGTGTVACSATGVVIQVTFKKEVGNQPALTASVSGLGLALEVQTLTCTATSGSFTLTVGSSTTAALSYASTAGVIQQALELLPTVTAVTVSLSTGTTACSASGVGIIVTFTKDYGDQAAITAGVAALQGGAGTIAVAETTAGSLGTIVVAETTAGIAGGTFTLTFNAQTTSAIPYDATAATVQAALVALSTIASATVAFSTGTRACSAAGTGIIVTFTGELGNQNAMTADISALQGGAGTIVIAETTTGATGGVTATIEMRTVQTLKCQCEVCTTDAGFIVGFDGEETALIKHDATTTDLQTALQALAGISAVTVTLSTGSAICGGTTTPPTTSVTFTGLTTGNTPKFTTTHSLCCQVREVQTVTCTAVQILEVQTHTCKATTGTFKLTFGGQTTGDLQWNANAAAVQTAVNGLSSVDSATVTFSTGTAACALSPGVGIIITFTAAGPIYGDQAPITHDVTKIAEVLEVQTATCKATTGTFTLTFAGQETAAINWNDNAAAVKSKLEALSSINGVTVTFSTGTTACALSPGVGIVITFTAWQEFGDAADMTKDDTLVAEVLEVQTVTCIAVAGTFKLAFGGQTTSSLNWDDNAATVQAALNALSTISGSSVAFSAGAAACAASPGIDIAVTFASPDALNFGDQAMMTAPGATVELGAVLETQTVVCTSQSSQGTFKLGFGGAETANIAFDATANDVKTAFEALAGVTSMTVSFSTGVSACTTAGTNTITLIYTGKLNFGDQALMTSNNAALGGVSEVQTVVCTGNLGSWDLTFGAATATIAYDATAAQVQTAFAGLSTVASGTVTFSSGVSACDAGGANTMTFTFTGDIDNQALMTSSNAALGGVSEVQTVVCTGNLGTFTLTFSGQTTAAIAYDATANAVKTAFEALSTVTSGTVAFSSGVSACDAGGANTMTFTWTGDIDNQALMTSSNAALGGVSEVQEAVCTGTAGTFTLTFSGQTTAAIAFDATAAQVKTAFEALSTVTSGTVAFSNGLSACTAGGANTITITFTGNAGDLALVTAGVAALDSGTGTVSITQATAGTLGSITHAETTAGALGSLAHAETTAGALGSLAHAETTAGALGSLAHAETTAGALGSLVHAETTAGTLGTLVIAETVAGVLGTVTIAETTKGIDGTVAIVETTKGIEGTISHAETVKGIAGNGFTLTHDGQTTSDIAFDASASTVKAAIDALTTVRTVDVAFSAGTVACASSPGIGITVTFSDDECDEPMLTADTTSVRIKSASNGLQEGAGTIAFTEVTKGTCPPGIVVDSADGTREYEDCSNRGICDTGTGECACSSFTNTVHEVQNLICVATGGSFTLTVLTFSTASIAYNANANAVRDAIQALTAFPTGSIEVSFSTGTTACAASPGVTVSITFKSNLGDQPPITADTTSLTGPGAGITGSVSEVQTVTCIATYGYFALTFGGQTTEALEWDSTAAYVETKINELSSVVGSVAVAFSSGVAACAASPGIGIAVTFSDIGNVSPLTGVIAPAGKTALAATLEVQTLTCTANSGTFTITFGTQTTALINYNDPQATLEFKLEALSTIGEVSVVYSTGARACSTTGVGIQITFLTEIGDQAAFTVGGLAALLDVGGAGTITVAETTAGSAGSLAIVETQVGSGTGTTGVSTEYNFTASNGAAAGMVTGYSFNDCGWYPATVTECPSRMIEDEVAATKFNYTCSGHGHCAGSPTWRCNCTTGWFGADCSLRECATGRAWFDEATATNVAHAGGAECSNRGICNRATGLCKCQDMFEGAACERLKCAQGIGPGESVAMNCTGNGQCKSMHQLAQLTTANGELQSYTYGATNRTATWDAHMIYGCHCGAGFAHTYYKPPDVQNALSYDCSLIACPQGDNPMTPTKEVQTLTCIGTGGTFTLSFGGQTTEVLAWDATAATVQAALNALNGAILGGGMSWGGVAVAYSTGTAACAASPGVGIAVTFSGNIGDLAALTWDLAPAGQTALTGGSMSVVETTKGTQLQNFEVQTLTCIGTGGTFTLTFRAKTTSPIAFDATAAAVRTALEALSTLSETVVVFSTGVAACAASPGVGIDVTFRSELGDLPAITADAALLTGTSKGVTVVETTKGTKDNIDCSEHGICNRATGVCKCFNGFTSSDHNNEQGDYRDCGYMNNNPAAQSMVFEE